MVPGVGGVYVGATWADHHDQFAFVVAPVAAESHLVERSGDAGRELGEHQGYVGNLHAGLFGMAPIVEAYTVRVTGPWHGWAEGSLGHQAGGLTAAEAGGQFGEEVRGGEGGHGVRAERPVGKSLQVVVVVTVDERAATAHVGQTEPHDGQSPTTRVRNILSVTRWLRTSHRGHR